MDKDQVSGKFDQSIGKAKEKLGEAVGNQKPPTRASPIR